MSQRKSSVSHIPLRRSNSSSNIPRQSRPTLRVSNTTSTRARSSSHIARSSTTTSNMVCAKSFVKSNSSSKIARPSAPSNLLSAHSSGTLGRSSSSSQIARSSANSNLLSVYSSGTLGRSSSYTNLLTPSQRLVFTTPSSSASKCPKMNDKDWTRTQLQRVKGFFLEIDPEMPPIKPLSIRTYVHSMNLLFKILDPRITITIENYKDAVPDYLKTIQYPYIIKPSVMKSPAVPSSWQYVLQIWIWLIDLLDTLRNADSILMSNTEGVSSLQLFYIGMHCMANQFQKFNKFSELRAEEKTNDMLTALARAYDFHYDELKALEDDEARLDAELGSLKKVYEDAKTDANEIKRTRDMLVDENAHHLKEKNKRRDILSTNIRELHIQNKNLEISTKTLKEKKESLQQMVSSQSCTKYELGCAKKKFAEMSHTNQLKEARLKHLKAMIAENDTLLTQQTESLQSAVYNINNKISSFNLKADRLQCAKIRENDLGRADFLEHLENFSSNCKQLDVDVEKRLKDLQATLEHKQEEKKMNSQKNEELKMEIQKLQKVKKDKIAAQDKYREDFNKQISELELEHKNKEEELTLLKSQRPDLDKIKKQLDGSLEREEKLRSRLNETLVKGEDFFVSMYNGIKKSMETQMQILQDITNTSEEVRNINLETLRDIVKDL